MYKDVLKKIFNKIHRIFFGRDAGQNMHIFAKNVLVTFFGGISAFGVLFFVNVFAARMLGPEEYGKYSVFLSIAQLLSLLFVLELDVSALFFLSKKNIEEKRVITASIMNIFMISIIVFSLLALSIFYFIDVKDVSFLAFIGVLSLGFVFAFERMMDAFLRSDGKYHIQSFLRFLDAVLVACALCVFFFVFKNATFYSYVGSVIFGSFFFGIFGLFFVRSILSRCIWNTKKISEIFRHNSYGLVNAMINGVIKNTDKILIASILGLGMSGIYAAYFTSSIIVGERIVQLFVNVFFPTMRDNTKNISRIYAKINAVFIKLFVFLFICASFGVFLMVSLYGKEYTIVWMWIVLGGLYIVVHFFASLYGWMLSSISTKGYKYYNVAFLYGAVAYGSVLVVSLVLDVFSVTSFFIALICYRAVSGTFSFFTVRNLI
ncbi:MAG: hypothetical protein CR972_00215 [Candidatus Moraniibacteriota bacterium]|nr:MAG: hypothetical protein CR972_00215 [Candidatus Moranbacteria bacterium]